MEYKLVWEDHFDVDGPVNSDIWRVEYYFGGANKENQFYTDRLENIYCKDSILHIVGLKENYKQANYTSARMDTYGKKSIGYGKIEIMAKLPTGKGTWPAFWLLAESIKEGTRWPLCGEIDMMENIGRRPNEIHFSLHSSKYNHNKRNHKTYFKDIPGILDGFNKYTTEWLEDKISFYINDEHHVTFKKGEDGDDAGVEGWPFIPPYFLIINFAIGGNWGGPIDESIFPQELLIDYVKVYEKV